MSFSLKDAFKDYETKCRSGKIRKSKISKMFKRLKLIVTQDELEKATLLLGVGGGDFKNIIYLDIERYSVL